MNGLGIISDNNSQYTFPSYEHQTGVTDIILTQQENVPEIPNEINYSSCRDNDLGEQLICQRSPNGHYMVIIPEDPGEIVNFVEHNALIGDYTETNEFVQLEENHYERERQRILLETTMSPLLAAVNDITQREAELELYLNQKKSVKRRLYENVDDRKSKEYCKTNSHKQTLVICDKLVESRARASLPTHYLSFFTTENNEQSICAKKEIPIRSQFGPMEGEIRFTSDVMLDMLRIQTPKDYPLLLIGKSRMLDVSNENTSNWMRFVRLANTFCEQNLQLFKENDKLYFQCVRTILPKEELHVGYSTEYAEQYNLSILYPSEQDKNNLYKKDNPWECYECEECFSTSMDLQKHLDIHENSLKLIRHNKKKRKKLLQNDTTNSIRCYHCNKVFMANFSLKKHLKLHKNILKCSTKKHITQNNVINNSKSNRNENTVDGNKKFRIYSCIYCSEKFRRTVSFQEHIVTHAVNDLFYCFMCKKKFLEYSLVRKHIKTFHNSSIYPCNVCGRQFKHISFLRRHKVIHSDKYDFVCTECGKNFKRKDKLKEHIARIHSEEKKKKLKMREEKLNQNLLKKKNIKKEEINDGSQYLKISPKKQKNKIINISSDTPITHKFITPLCSEDNNVISPVANEYYNYTYKCDLCRLGFKRRGMLVNHLVKRHPQIEIHSVPELNLPILKPQTLFYCYYCSKSYKSNAKRKLHMLKYHPGQKLPPSVRSNKSLEQLYVKIIGNIKGDIHQCHLCYKQYVSRTRLQMHFRKDHFTNYENNNNNSNCDVDIVVNQIINYRPPESPENKLLKLSSAALELEDPKFFDFLNEEDGSVICDNANNSNCPIENQTSDATGLSKVDINFKVINGEFSVENSSNTELNGFPQLFEESIACI